jgi:hypothetical protein
MPDMGTTLRERLNVSVAVLAFGLLRFIRFSSVVGRFPASGCRNSWRARHDHEQPARLIAVGSRSRTNGKHLPLIDHWNTAVKVFVA